MSKPTPLKVSAPVRRRPFSSLDENRGEENRSEQTRSDQGPGLFSSNLPNHYSPDPVTATVAREVWHQLTAGLATLPENDHGRDWPLPRRDRLRDLLAEFDEDLCRRAAREAREIVEGQERAPNITSLFEKKLRDLAAVRLAARASLEFAESLEGQVAA